MCFSNLIEILHTFHSTSTVPPTDKIIAYSSHQLRALNHANQVSKQTGKHDKISKITPYNAIATIRNLRINKKPIRTSFTYSKCINKRESTDTTYRLFSSQ